MLFCINYIILIEAVILSRTVMRNIIVENFVSNKLLLQLIISRYIDLYFVYLLARNMNTVNGIINSL